MNKADIGLIGLAVMGENLILNMESKGFSVAVYNRTTEKVDAFLSGRAKGKNIIGTHSYEEFIEHLSVPRKMMIMVKAGKPVDAVIDQLVPLLSKGDVIIDGGNSNYNDSTRRFESLKEKGIHFIGTGVSGGEEGALLGPSIMPGGSIEAWKEVKPILQKISAQVDNSPCCEWMGTAGAGHFVKMVHNGIEYGDIQLIAESYSLLQALGYDNEKIHAAFQTWNNGDLNSYLIEITRDIFTVKDPETGKYVVDLIMDTAGQKGTGKWTAIEALEQGIPLTLIGEAVFARCLSARKDERVAASEILQGKTNEANAISEEEIGKALFAAKIVSYAQGFSLIKQASDENKWNINFGDVAKIWRGGCIIRSTFLNDITKAFEKNSNNLLLNNFFKTKIDESQNAWRNVVSFAVQKGIPVPALSSALAYFDAFRTKRLPANLIQAQRDFFGAHTYERIDKPKGEFFHTNWTGKGGDTHSSTYNA